MHAASHRTTLSFAVVTTAAALVASITSAAQTQQKFPTKPVRLMLPSAAGSQTDNLGRLIGAKLSDAWGQPVVVDNRPGAVGTLATSIVAKATPDGHTLLLTTNHAISAALQPDLPYHPINDFAAVAQIGLGASIMAVSPALGVKSVNELITSAKAQPGKIIFTTSAVGTANQLSGARFYRAAGIQVVAVAFKGPVEATLELLGGRAHYTVQPLAVLLPHLKEGRLLALAALPRRLPVLPDVPALGEMFPEFKGGSNVSFGLLAPATTPRPILNQISKEIARIVDLPDIKARLLPTGFVFAPTTPEEYDKILREQIDRLTKLVKDLGLKPK